jgi:hypothetical protein
MSENLFCEGNRRVTQATKDGWYRTFKGYPEINDTARNMLKGMTMGERLLFFCEYVTDDSEYASFLTRDFEDGIWG